MKALTKNEMRTVEGGWIFKSGKKNNVKTYWYCGNCGYKTESNFKMGCHIVGHRHYQTSKIDSNGRIF